METQEGKSGHKEELRAGGGENSKNSDEPRIKEKGKWAEGKYVTERNKNSNRTEIFLKKAAETFIKTICFLFSGKLCECGTILSYGNISFDPLKVY